MPAVDMRNDIKEGGLPIGDNVPNVVMLDKVLDIIEQSKWNPGNSTKSGVFRGYRVDDGRLWNQSIWRQKTSCGTAMCFAGWVAELNGAEWMDTKTVSEYSRQFEFVRDPITGETVHIRNYAMQELGLDESEAKHLFNGSNTKGDIKEIVEIIKTRHNLL